MVYQKNGNTDSALSFVDRGIKVCPDDRCKQYAYLDKLEILCSDKTIDSKVILSVLDSIQEDFVINKNGSRPVAMAYLKLGNLIEARRFLGAMKTQMLNYHDTLHYTGHLIDLYSQEIKWIRSKL